MVGDREFPRMELKRENLWTCMGRIKVSKSSHGAGMLPRCLTIWHLLPLGVGSTVGAGVYVLIGTAAKEKTGPALPLAFLLAGVAAGLAALCYAELASRCPSAGSAYHYAYTTVGEGMAWVIGWALILEYTLSGSAVARAVSPNLSAMLDGYVTLPAFMSRIPLPDLGVVLDPVAAFTVLVVTCLLCLGIKESASVQAVMTALNVGVLLIVVFAGIYVGVDTDWPGYKQEGGYFLFGTSGVIGGAAMVFFAYIGFDAVASTAEEVKDPERDVPLGIALSLAVCILLYIAVAAVLVGLVPTNELDGDTPLAQAFSSPSMAWARMVTILGALAAMWTTLLGSLLPQPRILMAMARDGLLPVWFAAVNSNRIPINSTIITGVFAGSMAFLMELDQLSAMVSVGTLLAFTVASGAILVLRYVPPATSALDTAGAMSSRPAQKKDPSSSIPIASKPLLSTEPYPSSASLHESVAHHLLPAIFPSLDPAKLGPPEPGPAFDSLEPRFSEESLYAPFLSTDDNEDDLPLRLVDSVDSDNVRLEDASLDDLERIARDGFLKAPNEGSKDASSLKFKLGQKPRRMWAARLLLSFCIGVPASCTALALMDYLPWILAISVIGIGSIFSLFGGIGLFLIDQDEERHKFGNSGAFMCPWVPGLPICSIIINVYLLVNLGWGTWVNSLIWMGGGGIIYLIYGSKHSKLSVHSEKLQT